MQRTLWVLGLVCALAGCSSEPEVAASRLPVVACAIGSGWCAEEGWDGQYDDATHNCHHASNEGLAAGNDGIVTCNPVVGAYGLTYGHAVNWDVPEVGTMCLVDFQSTGSAACCWGDASAGTGTPTLSGAEAQACVVSLCGEGSAETATIMPAGQTLDVATTDCASIQQLTDACAACCEANANGIPNEWGLAAQCSRESYRLECLTNCGVPEEGEYRTPCECFTGDVSTESCNDMGCDYRYPVPAIEPSCFPLPGMPQTSPPCASLDEATCIASTRCGWAHGLPAEPAKCITRNPIPEPDPDSVCSGVADTTLYCANGVLTSCVGGHLVSETCFYGCATDDFGPACAGVPSDPPQDETPPPTTDEPDGPSGDDDDDVVLADDDAPGDDDDDASDDDASDDDAGDIPGDDDDDAVDVVGSDDIAGDDDDDVDDDEPNDGPPPSDDPPSDDPPSYDDGDAGVDYDAGEGGTDEAGTDPPSSDDDETSDDDESDDDETETDEDEEEPVDDSDAGTNDEETGV